MAEIPNNLAQAKWQITATTDYCESVEDFVTFLVYNNWSHRCTWWAKFKQVAVNDPKHQFAGEIKKKIAACQGPDCKLVIAYRDKLIREETK
jgi:hypothetical protein